MPGSSGTDEEAVGWSEEASLASEMVPLSLFITRLRVGCFICWRRARKKQMAQSVSRIVWQMSRCLTV